VLVLNPALIPTSVDVVIGDNVYELHFKVEPKELQDSPRLLEMDDDNDEADRKEDESAWEEEDRDYMQEDNAQSSDKVGTEPDLSTKSNGQPTSQKSNNKMNNTLVHSSMMDDAMVQPKHTDEEEYVVDMEGMENVEELYNVMTSSSVEAPGSEPATPRAEVHR
jgi:dynactin complex subunit